MEKYNSLVIGISGPTCSGKTSLSKLLNSQMENSILISQDSYFFTEDSGLLEFIDDLKYYNYDSVSCINMVALRHDLAANLNKVKCIFIDGFLLYEDESLVKMFDKLYFIEIDEKTARSRRADRVYDNQTDPETYFDRYIWPNYMKYKSYCKANYKNIVYLDGNCSTNHLANFLKNDIFIK